MYIKIKTGRQGQNIVEEKSTSIDQYLPNNTVIAAAYLKIVTTWKRLPYYKK